MLSDLQILNGDMSLEFDPLNTIYTITLHEGETKLDFNYKVADGYDASIKESDEVNNKYDITLTVYNDKEAMSYYFTVYKKEVESVSSSLITGDSLNIKSKEEMPTYVVPSIAVLGFLTILLCFTLLFKKR